MKILFLFILLIFPSQAFAQNFNVGVNPPILQIETEPPANVEAPISIENLSNKPIELVIMLKPFVPTDQENGQVRYLEETPSKYSALFDRMRVIDGNTAINELTLGPGQKKDLTFTINIPREIERSDYYFSIVFLSKELAPSDRTATQNIGGIAINVLLSTGEETKGVIQEFSAPVFVEKGPVPFTVRVKNTGDSFIAPQGEIEVKNLFGQTVGKVELQPVNILAKSVRSLPSEEAGETLWNERFVVGPYIATLNLNLSENGPVLERTILFLAFPGVTILVILLAVITLLYLYSRIKRKI